MIAIVLKMQAMARQIMDIAVSTSLIWASFKKNPPKTEGCEMASTLTVSYIAWPSINEKKKKWEYFLKHTELSSSYSPQCSGNVQYALKIPPGGGEGLIFLI